MSSCGITSKNVRQLSETNFFISHEALLLPYESAFTRVDSTTGDWYDTSAHMVWIGDRTRQLNGAHVEFCRGISNPIGIKVGPTSDYKELIKVIKRINPNNEKGKIVLIVRMGASKIEKIFPNILRKIKSAKLNIVWSSDPMHANIEKSKSGYKTRNFNAITKELEIFFDIHYNSITNANGVHFELTPNDVTECVGGIRNIKESDLHLKYETSCDPRLNHEQSIESVSYTHLTLPTKA